MLKLEQTDVFYGASQILFKVGFEVKRGQTMALLGRNGAGKSTTFKAIAGVASPRSGRITLNDKVISGRPPYRIARAGIAYVPEDRQVFSDISVHDNLQIARKHSSSGKVEWTLERVYESFPILAGMQDRKAGRLSGGEQQLLTIARSLMGNPDILLLDEPSEGLAPIIVQTIGDLIMKLRDSGVTILLAEQNMHFCLGIATHAAIIDKGCVVHASSIEDLRNDKALVKRYLAV